MKSSKIINQTIEVNYNNKWFSVICDFCNNETENLFQFFINDVFYFSICQSCLNRTKKIEKQFHKLENEKEELEK